LLGKAPFLYSIIKEKLNEHSERWGKPSTFVICGRNGKVMKEVRDE